jgi:hypothetical protein
LGQETVRVSFATLSGNVTAKADKFTWLTAMAVLGTAGWELVSVASTSERGHRRDVAYFKRHVQDGRPIDDVRL